MAARDRLVSVNMGLQQTRQHQIMAKPSEKLPFNISIEVLM
jgi:hypothetical protein